MITTMAQEVVKMKQGMSYSCKEKTIILNVFKYFKNTYPEKCVTEIVRRTAKATGCSEKSVFQFRKEEASVEGFKEPSKTKIRKNININSRFIKYDDNVRQEIRNIIYDLKYRNIIPSLSLILKNVNGNEKLPNFSLMTLRRLLFDMGFCYEKEKNGNKSILVEKTSIKKENLPVKNRNEVKASISTKPNIPQSIPKTLPVPQAPLHQIPPLPQQPAQPHNVNLQQNQMFVPNQAHRGLGVPLGHHENHMVEPIHLQHSMMWNHRMPHQVHPVPHNVGFMHHTAHPHGMVTHQ
ncbi:uncharacterized protein [Leptinotarsa decemlineata]|uniref:uncharacterized protein n=1 Tax=Leptinotarsa decemlineata TaxID=7539 RepID=UPI003D3064C2